MSFVMHHSVANFTIIHINLEFFTFVGLNIQHEFLPVKFPLIIQICFPLLFGADISSLKIDIQQIRVMQNRRSFEARQFNQDLFYRLRFV